MKGFHMSRHWRAWGMLLLLLGAPAVAQDVMRGGMLGLPLVVREKGWARYEALAKDMPARFVVRVGATTRHEGQPGRWLDLEVEVPGTGRVLIQFLVVGAHFKANNIPLLRVTMPDKTQREHRTPFKQGPALRSDGRFLQKSSQRVADRLLEVMEYSFPGGILAEWSEAVPGLGLIRVNGADSFHLVDFGVGGDPWKEKSTPPIFPAPPKKP